MDYEITEICVGGEISWDIKLQIGTKYLAKYGLTTKEKEDAIEKYKADNTPKDAGSVDLGWL